MKLSANFSLAEMTKSQTATRKGINNEPSTAHVENLIHLAETVLQPVREHFGKAVVISSGYRSPELCEEAIVAQSCAKLSGLRLSHSMPGVRQQTSRYLELTTRNSQRGLVKIRNLTN